MLPKFANHSLLQDAKVVTRSEIAKQVGHTCADDDEANLSLKRNLDNLLQDTWADVLAQSSSPPKAKKHRKTAQSHTEDGQLVFRLISGMKHPQHISLDPKLPPPLVIREPECEDDEREAEVRRIRAQSVAVEFKTPEETMRQINAKPVALETKIALAKTPLRHLPPLLVIEEARLEARHLKTTDIYAASPHEPRPSCIVLPVKSDRAEIQRKKRRKAVKDRPAPAYWRPSPDMRGKCMGYALGYPSSWASDQLYVRDTMKRGVQST